MDQRTPIGKEMIKLAHEITSKAMCSLKTRRMNVFGFFSASQTLTYFFSLLLIKKSSAQNV